MARLYDARGNRYLVVFPGELREAEGRSAAVLASTASAWAPAAIEQWCARPRVSEGGGKPWISDGLLVGPFAESDAHALLIVNTDGSLAERSGNGLTIFSQFLVDQHLIDGAQPVRLRVHHGRGTATDVVSEAATHAGRSGFWIDMGAPAFGAAAAGADPYRVGRSEFHGRTTERVFALEHVDAAWNSSRFVRLGNPHCVTFVAERSALPSMARLEQLHASLLRIANDTDHHGIGDPCLAGVNLQWACVSGSHTLEAQVFERGEGPTRSSGSSAAAVASAARDVGLVSASDLTVTMPGGVAPISFVSVKDATHVRLFGEAILVHDLAS